MSPVCIKCGNTFQKDCSGSRAKLCLECWIRIRCPVKSKREKHYLRGGENDSSR